MTSGSNLSRRKVGAMPSAIAALLVLVLIGTGCSPQAGAIPTVTPSPPTEATTPTPTATHVVVIATPTTTPPPTQTPWVITATPTNTPQPKPTRTSTPTPIPTATPAPTTTPMPTWGPPAYTLWSRLELLELSGTEAVTTSALSDNPDLSLAFFCFPHEDVVLLEVVWVHTDVPLDQIEWVAYRLYDENLEATDTFIPPVHYLGEAEAFDSRGIIARNALMEIPEPRVADWFILELGIAAGGEEVVQGRFLMEELRATLRTILGRAVWRCSTP